MLKQLFENVWVFERDLGLLPGIRLPVRMTIVRLSDGTLFVHSPLRVDDALAKEIDALGAVGILAAPSRFHWMFLKKAAERWPRARVFGALGLETKLRDLTFDSLPRHGALDGTDGEIVVRHIEGVPRISEHVFLHHPSRTLLVTDLVFNMHEADGVLTSTFLRAAGAWKKLSHERLFEWLTTDESQKRDALTEVLAWDFDRLVMAHGSIIETGARAELAKVFG